MQEVGRIRDKEKEEDRGGQNHKTLDGMHSDRMRRNKRALKMVKEGKVVV